MAISASSGLLQGLGLSYAFEPLAREHLRTGRLGCVLESYAATVPGFYLVLPESIPALPRAPAVRRDDPRVRGRAVVVDELREGKTLALRPSDRACRSGRAGALRRQYALGRVSRAPRCQALLNSPSTDRCLVRRRSRAHCSAASGETHEEMTS